VDRRSFLAGAGGLLATEASWAARARSIPVSTVSKMSTPLSEVRQQSLGPWGFDLSGMDRTVRPGDSFNLYVNGGWIARAEIPADLSSYGPTVISGQVVERQLRAIIEEAAAAPPHDEDAARIGALYRSFMDEGRVERLDASLLRHEIAPILAATSHSQLALLSGRSHAGFRANLFDGFIFGDASGKKLYALHLTQGGLGLPDRDYYLQPSFGDRKAAYRDYIESLLRMADWPASSSAADAVLLLETAIAKASWSQTDRRDVSRTYNPMKLRDLPRECPGFGWEAFFQGLGVAPSTTAIVLERSAFPRLAAIFERTPLPTLKAWLAAQKLNAAASYLSRRFVEARFQFRDRKLSGQTDIEPRWKRGVSLVDSLLGEGLGREWVARYFPPANKAAVRTIVENIRSAMDARIAAVDWMTPETKAFAQEKLRRMGVKIGYPDRWRDYRGLVMRADDLVGNVRRSAAFDWDRDRNRIGQPIDLDEWAFTPQTGQAYNSFTRNEIVFCAGMLQPPNFDPQADAAINYGAVGAIIGHEISHGFDDQGRKYDAEGNLRDWWNAEDARQFESRAAALAEQFDRIEALPGLKLNGRLSLGENIGDLGGVLLALDAYKISLRGTDPPIIDGFTGEQRVMLGWAQKWRRKFRDAEIRRIVASDSHAPTGVRAEAPLRNVDAWYRAFNVAPGDKLYLPPDQRVRIW
jgi:putative endopeptidase